MQVSENRYGRRRSVYWELPDRGWEDVARQIDPFLASAIEAIAAEYAGDPVKWLEINHWPNSGRLIIFPAQDGPYGNRGERIYFELSSAYLENECLRIGEFASAQEQAAGWQELEAKVWGRVGDSLRYGQAARRLAEARKVHRFKLAAFDYDFGEGLFYLAELDEEAAAEMQEELARSNRALGIGE